MKIATFDEMVADMESGIWDFTEEGKCSSCGQCCSDLLPVSEKELKRIRAYIKKRGVKERKHLVPLAAPVVDMTCPFRNNVERRCEIYDVRPAICRDFQCDKPRKGVWAKREFYEKKLSIISMRRYFFGEGRRNAKH